MREPVASNDAIWLQDSASNRMVINAVILADRLEAADLRATFRRRILEGPEAPRFERLRCRITGGGHRQYWERDPDFDLDRHIVEDRVALGSQEAFQDYVGHEAGRELDGAHPRWSIQVMDGYEPGTTALLVRVHHSIGDGEALVSLLFALVDEPIDGMAPAKVPPGRGGFLRAAAVPLAAPGILLRRLAWHPDHSPMHGPALSGHKHVAWTRPMDLEVVKRVRQAIGATVNDVLMASVSAAFSHYLEDHGDPPPSRFLVSMPMNVRTPGAPLLCDNHFAPVPLELPAGPGVRARRILEVKARMDRVKRSAVPRAIYGLQRAALALLPDRMSRGLIDFLANKCTAVVTNVTGPRGEVILAGSRVRSMIFWVPQRARIGIGVSILSFSGRVQVGIIADEALVPDPSALVRAFEAEFDSLSSL